MRFTHRMIRRRAVRPRARRGVVGVLSMMFMIIFGSLAVAMAIVSQGNLTTAQTQLRVNNAIGAADTGLAIAQSRLAMAAAQFRIERGVIDADYADDLWTGTFDSDDGVVLDQSGAPATQGLRAWLGDLHEDDAVIAIESEYTPQEAWLVTSPIVLESIAGQTATAAQITYIPIDASTAVRAVVTGYAWDWTSERWISRTVQQDFQIGKRVNHAILGPSKIMIGKNVQVNGPLGARFAGVENQDGHPLVMRSDFYGLANQLDDKLDDLYDAVVADDTDGDNRLRTHHTIESRSLATLNLQDYDGDSTGDNAFDDASGDGAVDDFDIFMHHFDSNGDGRLVLSASLTAGTPADGMSPEFADVDENLALLIDNAQPDRNGDGAVDARDTALGYRDGVIDYRDRYAKIRGAVVFRANRADWEDQDDGFGNPIGDYQPYVQGPIRAEAPDRPITFAAGDDVLPEINTDTFDTANSDLADAADGGTFQSQAGLAAPPFTLVLGADGEVVGQAINPDLETVIEATPWGSGAPTDFYQRPVFRDIVFKDVVIPRGLNALFVNCTFVGVTRVENYQANTHPSWQFYGQQLSSLALKYPPPPAESEAQLDNDYFTEDIIQPADFDIPRLSVGGADYVNTKPLANNIRFHDCMFVGSIVADKPTNYTHIRNKLQFTGGTRFYQQHPDYPDDPDYNPESSDVPEIQKSAMMAPHYSVDIGANNAPQSQDVNLQGLIIAGVLDIRGNTTINGALLLTFEPTMSDPALQHFGQSVGNPADFNATLGYFGPDDGDEEGFNLQDLTDLDGDGVLDIGWDQDGDGIPDADADPATSVAVPFNGFGRVQLNWDPDLVMPDGLIAPIQISRISASYREGRLVQGDYD